MLFRPTRNYEKAGKSFGDSRTAAEYVGRRSSWLWDIPNNPMVWIGGRRPAGASSQFRRLDIFAPGGQLINNPVRPQKTSLMFRRVWLIRWQCVHAQISTRCGGWDMTYSVSLAGQ